MVLQNHELGPLDQRIRACRRLRLINALQDRHALLELRVLRAELLQLLLDVISRTKQARRTGEVYLFFFLCHGSKMFDKLPCELREHIRSFMDMQDLDYEEPESYICTFDCKNRTVNCTDACREYYMWIETMKRQREEKNEWSFQFENAQEFKKNK